jgi:hypothetical protein
MKQKKRGRPANGPKPTSAAQLASPSGARLRYRFGTDWPAGPTEGGSHLLPLIRGSSSVAISRCSAVSRSAPPPSSSYKMKTAAAGNPSISAALSQTPVPLCSPLCKHVCRWSSSGAGDSGHLELQEEVWEVRLAMSSVSVGGIEGGSLE